MKSVVQPELFEKPVVSMYLFEDRAFQEGYKLVAGIDEAGRGPLAGPVVAAAVILDPAIMIAGLNDSKKLSPRQRDLLFDLIMEKALAVAVAEVSAGVIDRINILQATRQAMLAAVEQLQPQPDYLLIDGINTIDSSLSQQAVKQGDARSASIAAASIVAKVTRDRQMQEYDQKYPGYGFASHKGYGSAGHLAMLRQYGPCPIHRLSFAGVVQPGR